MKKIFILIFLIFSFSFSNNNLNLTTEEIQFIKKNPIINVGAETDWPPFDFVENGKYTGIAKEYLTLIEKSTGLKFNYVYGYTWNQLLSLTKEKKLDLLPILAKTQDREKYLLYTDNSYISIRDYLFSSSQKFNSLDELNGKTLAVPAGYAQEEYLKKNYPKIKVILVKDVLQGIDYVILNKVDALISNIALVDYFTKKHNLTGINAQFALIENDNLYMAFRDDYPILKSIIQKALANITQIEKNKISDKFLVNFHDDEDFTFSKEELEFIKNNKKIYIANELDWIPYDYNDDGIAKGYIIDYTKLLFSKIGMEPIFITDTWQNIMKKFKNNDINVLPVISYNKKREEILNYSNAFLQQEFSIVTKSSRFDLINFDDLKGKKVALIKSWNSTKIIKENYPDINIVEFDNIKDIFEAVKNNIVDASIQNSILSSFYIKKDYNEVLKNDATVRIKNFDTSLYMGVNKDKPILKELINKSMKQISRQEMKTLNNKWLDDRTKIDFTVKEKQFIENTIVKVVFTDNWGPINFVEDGKAYGLGYDFWKLIVNKANLKTTIDYKDNFSSALKAIELKENDLIIATTKTKDREKYAIFSNTFHKAPIGIATLQDKNYIPNASYLVGKKVGVGRNYTAHKILEKLYPRIEFVFVKDIKEGLQLLSNNEIYALVDNMPVLAHNIKKYAYSDVKISGNTGLDFNLQVMIRDDYPILQSIVNKVLAELSAEEKETIYNKWAKIDFEKEIDYLSYLKFVIPLLLVILFILYKNRELVRYQRSLKLTKYELENTLKSFRTLVDLTIEGIVIVKDEKIVFCNNVFKKMFGFKIEDNMINKNINELFEQTNKSSISKIINKNNSKTYEINGLKSIDNKFPTLVKSKEIFFDNNASNIISIIDMSEIKDKENILIQQSKMASLGEMIGNIAHQWRQPLSFISTSASGIKLQKEFGIIDEKEMSSTLDRITETTKFLSQTIDDFQNYLKNDKIKKEFNVNSSINTILNITKGSIVNNFINLKLDLEENLYLYGYENELNQAILNVLNNAKDALSEIDKDNRYLAIKTYRLRNRVLVEIVDNAGGINPAILDKIFEPYFTTKHKSQGTGLGLFMTHKIITESMHGQINITNTSYTFEDKKFDKCTKVVICFPIKKA